MGNFKRMALLMAASFLIPVELAGAQSLLLPEAEVQAPAADLSADVSASMNGMLVPFAEASDRFELTGEADTAEFTFHLSEKQAKQGGKIVLAYKNAVSVLPDDAIIKVEVNGKATGEFPVVSPFAFTPQKITLNAGQLKVGRNVARLSIRQHHRVDCSLEATYELWTRLDPVTSGFETGSPLAFAKFDDLYATGRMEGGATELRLVMPEAANAGMLNNAMPVVQALALYLQRDDLIVTVADRPGDGPGIDLFVAGGPVQYVNQAAARLVGQAPFGVTVRNSDDANRAAIIFRANGPQDLSGMLVEAVRGPMNAGLKQGLNAKTFGLVHARGGQEFSLKDAGIRSSTFAGRLVRTHFDMVLPADFYPAEYDTVDLKLSAATSPGLEPSSQMLVRVNDRVVNSFPFRNTDGQSFDGKLIELPLRAFRPGVNKIEMLAELPDEEDKACAPGARDDSKPRYILLGETALSVPELARVTRLPDLSAFSGNGYPYQSGKPFEIYMEKPDSHAASAALTIITRLAMAAGSPVKGNFRLEAPPVKAVGNALVITVDSQEMRQTNEDQKAGIEPSFRIDDRAANLMKTDLMATATVPETPALPEANLSGEDQLIQAFENSTADNGGERSWTTRIKAFLFGASSKFGSWLSYEDEKPLMINSEDALLTVVQVANSEDSGVTTIIRAASPDDLSKGVRRLADPSVWRMLNGGAALIEAKTLALVNLPGNSQSFAEVTDQSIGNYRRIAAAWFSDNFQFYVALVIMLIGFFGAWLGKLIPTKGVRSTK